MLILSNKGGVAQHGIQHVTQQVEKLIGIIVGEHNRQELQQKLGLADRENFRANYLQASIDLGLVEMTLPEKPRSKNQKYRLTSKGIEFKNTLK